MAVRTPPRRQRIRGGARRVFLTLPYVSACVAIYAVSSMPRPPVPDVLLFPHADKVMHAGAYGVLSILASWMTLGRPWPRETFFRLHRVWPSLYRRGMRNAFGLTAGYGCLDELHQAFVPGRTASVADCLADGFGAAIALSLLHVWRTRQRASRPRTEAKRSSPAESRAVSSS